MKNSVEIRNLLTGRVKNVRDRLVPYYTKHGKWEVVADEPEVAPEPAPPLPRAPSADPLDDLTYAELRALVAERNLEPEGRKRDDLLRALRGRTYSRRDLTAEE